MSLLIASLISYPIPTLAQTADQMEAMEKDEEDQMEAMEKDATEAEDSDEDDDDGSNIVKEMRHQRLEISIRGEGDDLRRQRILLRFDELPEDLQERLATFIEEGEHKDNLKHALSNLESIDKEQRKEFLREKLANIDESKKAQKRLRKLNKQRQRFSERVEKLADKIARHNFKRVHAEHLRDRLNKLLERLEDAGATNAELEAAVEEFKGQVMIRARQNRQEKFQEGIIPFPDTPDDEDEDVHGWDPAFFEFIDRLKNRGIVKGFDDGEFKPGNAITTAELLKISLGGAGDDIDFEGSDPGDEGDESLREQPKWQRILFKRARDKNIFKGGEADPDRPATRSEAVRFILRSYGIPVQKGIGRQFNDVDAGNQDIDIIETARELGIIKGIGEGKFGPALEVSRAEMAKIIANAEAVAAALGIIGGVFSEEEAQ